MDQISFAKAILWEEAKGKLQAMVAVAGQCPCTDTHLVERFNELRDAVDGFINGIENNGLQE